MYQPTMAGLADTPVTLWDGESGKIVFVPAVFDPDDAAAYFRTLRESIAWRAEERPMYDRVVSVPRLVAWFDKPAGLPAPLDAIVATAERKLAVRFRSAGLNLYRDGRDSVAWHGDKEVTGHAQSMVAIASFGSTRRFLLRRKDLRQHRSFSCELTPGSVIAMSGAAQTHWEHCVPKETRAVGPRISVVMRQTATD